MSKVSGVTIISESPLAYMRAASDRAYTLLGY